MGKVGPDLATIRFPSGICGGRNSDLATAYRAGQEGLEPATAGFGDRLGGFSTRTYVRLTYSDQVFYCNKLQPNATRFIWILHVHRAKPRLFFLINEEIG